MLFSFQLCTGSKSCTFGTPRKLKFPWNWHEIGATLRSGGSRVDQCSSEPGDSLGPQTAVIGSIDTEDARRATATAAATCCRLPGQKVGAVFDGVASDKLVLCKFYKRRFVPRTPGLDSRSESMHFPHGLSSPKRLNGPLVHRLTGVHRSILEHTGATSPTSHQFTLVDLQAPLPQVQINSQCLRGD